MLNKGLFVTDLDGTLLSYKDVISEENVQKLKEFKKKNGYIAVATGRRLIRTQFLKDIYGLEFDAIIALNGALIYINSEEVKRYIMDKEANERFIKDYIDILKNADFIIDEEKVKLENYLKHKDDSELLGINIELKNMDDIYIDGLVKDMQHKYGKYFSIFKNQNYIDIAPYNVSKGKALKIIRDRLGISNDNVYSIGDSGNDISMIKEAGIGATFSNAEPKIREVASVVVDSFTEFISHVIDDC